MKRCGSAVLDLFPEKSMAKEYGIHVSSKYIRFMEGADRLELELNHLRTTLR